MSKVSISNFYIKSIDGLLLHGNYWKPAGNTNAIIYLIHGLGGHIGRFSDFANSFCNKNIAVIGIDLRGHGRSEGKRGHANNLSELIGDIHAMIIYGQELTGSEIPYFLYGNSMGGLLAVQYVNRMNVEFKGVILAAPWFRLTNTPSGSLIRILHIINYFVPEFIIRSKVKSEELRSEVAYQEEARNDKLAHNRISVRLLLLVLKLGIDVLKTRMKSPHLPVLIFHGEDDPVTSSDASKDFYTLNTSQCTLVILKDTLHEIHLEPCFYNVLNQIENWIKENDKRE